jgi:cytochrome c
MHMHKTRLPLVLLALLLFSGLIVLASCGSTGGQAASGDPAKGELIFNGGSDCKACHTTTDQKLVGPGLKGVMDGKGPYGEGSRSTTRTPLSGSRSGASAS